MELHLFLATVDLSRRKLNYYTRLYTKHDLPAGLTVFLVALPLCLGIALASGAPLYSGILSGIIGGLVVSLVSGSSLGVSGPAAGLTTVVAAALAHYDFPTFMAMVVGAGALQVLLGTLRLGTIAGYFPSSVIKGMLAAIGIILISKQLPVAIGYSQPDFWSAEFINLISNTHLFTNIKEFYGDLSKGAILITSISLLAYYIWDQPRFKKLQSIPAPLFVVLASVLLNQFFRAAVPSLAIGDNQLVHIPAQLFTGFHLPDFSKFTSDFNLIKYALTIGVLASLETLLCVEAIDKLDPWHRTTPANRELIAQGVGNMACGLFGALPMTAVIVRGSANIDAGGRTRWSSFTHGFLMLVAVLAIPFAINMIPLCALASILVVTGLKLTRPKLYVSQWKLGMNQFLPFALTIVVILFTDLLIGVSIGLLLSIFYIIRHNYIAEYDVKQSTFQGITTYTLTLHTNVTFLDKAKMRHALDKIPSYSRVVIDGSLSKHIDRDVLEMVSEYCENAKRRGIEVVLQNVERVTLTDIH